MNKVKKDILGRNFYKSMKKHPILKNPITLVYIVALIVVAASYIIYLIYKEPM